MQNGIAFSQFFTMIKDRNEQFWHLVGDLITTSGAPAGFFPIVTYYFKMFKIFCGLHFISDVQTFK